MAVEHGAYNMVKHLCENGVDINTIYQKKHILDLLFDDIIKLDPDEHFAWMLSAGLNVGENRIEKNLFSFISSKAENRDKIIRIAELLVKHGYQFDMEFVEVINVDPKLNGNDRLLLILNIVSNLSNKNISVMQKILNTGYEPLISYFAPMAKNKKFNPKHIDVKKMAFIKSLGFECE